MHMLKSYIGLTTPGLPTNFFMTDQKKITYSKLTKLDVRLITL